ncbi:hypothetical protein [Ferroplasma acidiphilum]|uniref:hypothetical protein n=1 Tax=Ferroplasma acidiphilum TaxID=74969 RepID=UPI002814C946|nr:hypothetical protein [Ferroplasma acidiphilum]WMT53479.1 MAG: hypothetical protein RE473_01185 [Ferroplasma acidiphilum]
MLISETTGINDMECHIKLNIDSFMAQNLKLLGKDYTLFFRKEGDDVYMKTFVDKSFEHMLVPNPDAFQQIDNYFSITEKLKFPIIFELISSLNSIPTVMMHYPYLSDGMLDIIFSYMHRYSKNVTEALIPITSVNKLVGDISIHPSGGALQTLLNFSKTRPLTVIRFRIHRDAHDDRKLQENLESAGSIGRLVTDYIDKKQFRMAVISEKPLELLPGVEKIPGEENFYWITINNPILGKVMEKAGSRGIYIDTTYFQIEKKHLVITQFIPKIRTIEYMQILFNTSMAEINRNDVAIDMVTPLSEHIINFL